MRVVQVEKFAEKLKVGQEYAFKKLRKTLSNGRPGTERYAEYFRLIKKYPHIALFEDERGFRVAYNYVEAMLAINGTLM